jgi:hypothetical protein
VLHRLMVSESDLHASTWQHSASQPRALPHGGDRRSSLQPPPVAVRPAVGCLLGHHPAAKVSAARRRAEAAIRRTSARSCNRSCWAPWWMRMTGPSPPSSGLQHRGLATLLPAVERLRLRFGIPRCRLWRITYTILMIFVSTGTYR